MNIIEVFIKRPVAAVMFIGVLVVFGLLSYRRVGVDLFPSIDIPFATATVIYPGADPETMETKVAEVIEDEVSTIGGMKSVRSVNLESVSQVIVEFELGVDADWAADEVRTRIASIERDLPSGIEPPVIEKLDIGAAPIMTVVLSGDIPLQKLSKIAENKVKARIERIQGVGGVNLAGDRQREAQVLLDPGQLSGFGLTADDIAQAIRAQNLEVPGGRLQVGGREFGVKTKGELSSPAEVADIILPQASVAAVRVSDVANVVDGMEEERSWSALDGKRAVSLIIRKQSGSNTVALAEEVREIVAELRPELEQQGIAIDVPKDSSVFIEHSINDVQFDLVFGALLAVIIIFLMLVDVRATIISAVAIPTSVIATFAFINVMGFTFNNMTMLALSLSIGILIDDAIVVIENIHRHLAAGKPPMQAAAEATQEIFLPVLAMTSTIIAVFLPVGMMDGIVGRFFYQFGLTVSFAVGTSMVVSFVLTPMLSSRFLKEHDAEHSGWLARTVEHHMSALERAYAGVIRWALDHKAPTLLGASLTLVASVYLVTLVESEFVPKDDQSQFTVNVELPTGTDLNAAREFVASLADDIKVNAPGVKHALATIGGGDDGEVHRGTIDVAMVRGHAREFSQEDLMRWVRRRFAHVDQAKISVAEVPMIGGSGFRTQPVQFYIRGNDLAELEAVSHEMLARFAKEPGFVDLDTTYRGGKPELALSLDRERAAAFGVPVASVAQTVRLLLAGDAIGEIQDEGETYDVTMRLAEEDKSRIGSLAGLEVRSVTGAPVDLSNLVNAEEGSGPSRIERRAKQREVMVLAGLEGIPVGTAMTRVREIAGDVVPAHLETGFDGEASNMEESFIYMIEALILAILLVYMILATQFDSFLQPVTIMVSLPLSVVGAFGALWLTGMTLSIFSMIGVIMLMGLVTKNAILLVDFANNLVAEGRSMHDALVEAGTLRLRPILMTTAAMVFGMLPVALAMSEGGESRAPMAVVVIGGLLTSTILTLVVVPAVHLLLHNLVNRLSAQSSTPQNPSSPVTEAL